MAVIDNIIAPKNELAIRSKNTSSGRDVTNVRANSELGEHIGINASFENPSGYNNVLQVSNANDETRNNNPDKPSELSVPALLFDRKKHTYHMMTGQTAQKNQTPEFRTGRTLTPRNPPSHQHQNLSTQLSQDNNLPIVQQTPGNQNKVANNSINRLVDAIAGIPTQQRPRTTTTLKPVSTNTLVFDGETRNLKFLRSYFTQCSKCNQR